VGAHTQVIESPNRPGRGAGIVAGPPRQGPGRAWPRSGGGLRTIKPIRADRGAPGLAQRLRQPKGPSSIGNQRGKRLGVRNRMNKLPIQPL
jgi:hypothetical protein